MTKLNSIGIAKEPKDTLVVVAMSGGVDSSVVAALLHEAIGDKLTCVFVDNGLLRLNEGNEVMKTFKENMGVKVIRVDAQQYFYSELLNESNQHQNLCSHKAQCNGVVLLLSTKLFGISPASLVHKESFRWGFQDPLSRIFLHQQNQESNCS